MKMLLTGASGFLGRNLLLMNEYDVITLGLSEADDITVDLAKKVPSFT